MVPFSLTEDIKSVSDVKKHARKIFDHLHRSGRPVVVTVNGKPDVVLLDVRVFETKLKAFNLATLLEAGEEDVRHKRVRSTRGLLKDLRQRAASLPG